MNTLPLKEEFHDSDPDEASPTPHLTNNFAASERAIYLKLDLQADLFLLEFPLVQGDPNHSRRRTD